MLFPVVWMFETSLKEHRDIYSVPAKFLELRADALELQARVRPPGGPRRVGARAQPDEQRRRRGLSTLLAIIFGVPAAWAYSRFNVRAKKDQLFFILSTRFMPPVVVVIPIFLMYSQWFNLYNKTLGLCCSTASSTCRSRSG